MPTTTAWKDAGHTLGLFRAYGLARACSPFCDTHRQQLTILHGFLSGIDP
jgi:hypothetical protein